MLQLIAVNDVPCEVEIVGSIELWSWTGDKLWQADIGSHNVAKASSSVLWTSHDSSNSFQLSSWSCSFQSPNSGTTVRVTETRNRAECFLLFEGSYRRQESRAESEEIDYVLPLSTYKLVRLPPPHIVWTIRE